MAKIAAIPTRFMSTPGKNALQNWRKGTLEFGAKSSPS